ncbi:MAG: response regulator [Cyanobacteria bacterium J06581_3]
MINSLSLQSVSLQPVSLSQLRHDLRTPINAILGYSEILLEDLPEGGDRTATSTLKKIHACGQQLLTLINTLTKETTRPVVDYATSEPHTVFSEADQLALVIPLDAISGYCDWLSHNTEITPKQDIEKIRNAANQLLVLINNFSHATAEETIQNAPIAPAPKTTSPAQASLKTSDSAHVPITPTSQQSGHLLVVDDNQNNRELLSRQLIRQGYRVETAINGEQALAKVSNQSYDLILLDILMPELNGYDVLHRLMQHKHWRRIPVIMISALDEIDSVVRCIERGAADYLTKPFNPVILNARISACLEKKRLHDLEMVHLEQLGTANAQMSHYLQEVDRITAAAAAVESSTFNPDSLETVAARTDELGRLARVFTHTVQAMSLREQELRIAEAQYRSIFENALEGIFQSNQEGHFLNVNPALAKIYGYDTPTEMLRAITDISGQVYVDPQARIDFLKQMQTCDELKNWEYQIYRKDGSITWVEENTRAVRDLHGQILYFEGIVQDISDRVYREEQLRRQLKELQIEIDHDQRKEEVVSLTSSNYFQEVKKEIAAINLEDFWT